jgi:hypothetical protein
MSGKLTNRTTIELFDLKDRIEAYSDAPAWRELSLGGKCRSLMLETLERRDAEIEAQQASQQAALNSPASGRAELFVKALVAKADIDVLDLGRLAGELGIPSQDLARILTDCRLGNGASKEKSSAKS